MNSKYFKEKEMECKCGCGTKKMDDHLLKMLDEARRIAKVPFVINSGRRCKKHNEFVGGVKNSAHTLGKAVDIKVHSATDRYRILTALIHVGFVRIGVYESFIHVDIDLDKPHPVVW